MNNYNVYRNKHGHLGSGFILKELKVDKIWSFASKNKVSLEKWNCTVKIAGLCCELSWFWGEGRGGWEVRTFSLAPPAIKSD